jgi:hypothetical protein
MQRAAFVLGAPIAQMADVQRCIAFGRQGLYPVDTLARIAIERPDRSGSG